jgi:hypothetical protein
MLIKHSNDFFIQWDTTYSLSNNMELGVFNFWIDDQSYPGKGTNITLIPLFNDLVSNIEKINQINKDLGSTSLDLINFSLDSDQFVCLDTGELFQYGFGLSIGFDKNTERLFYTVDYENSFSEIILPRGTLVETLKSLQQFIN